MVFFHGGGYGSGAGTFEAYNPSYLLDHNIVLVTSNYRLGSLGSYINFYYNSSVFIEFLIFTI